MNKMQQKNFRHMVKLGLPEEWAWLIAERSNVDVSKWKSMSECLIDAFPWALEKDSEMRGHWASVYFAISDEEQHAKH